MPDYAAPNSAALQTGEIRFEIAVPHGNKGEAMKADGKDDAKKGAKPPSGVELPR